VANRVNDAELRQSIAGVWLAGRVTAPDGPVTVQESFETHTCFVFLDSNRAYKVRKPIDLGFLDYSRTTHRWQTSQQEFTLGKRISPQTYVGVWSLATDRSDRLDPDSTSGEPILVMQRLPQQLCAERVFADCDEPVSRWDRAVADCCRFHTSAPEDRRPDGWGAIANTTAAWTINFEQMPPDDETIPLSKAERTHLEVETAAWLDDLRPVLAGRINTGRIREGHGDLRLQHVYLTEPWSVIDPLEFDRSLRFCDVAAEICFLAMELDELGRRDAADYIIDRYATLTDDDSLLTVAPFFKRYRAVVRGKIEWIRAGQVAGEERDQHLRRSRHLFALALSYQYG
jgi:aminoglycoside phosphotransferase family enzyme